MEGGCACMRHGVKGCALKLSLLTFLEKTVPTLKTCANCKHVWSKKNPTAATMSYECHRDPPRPYPIVDWSPRPDGTIELKVLANLGFCPSVDEDSVFSCFEPGIAMPGTMGH